ncbi:STAS/SEC14 domain-containing protein [Modicisalibacter coralii]|uniref:STAS/SEC14 domain-containing protein n=1 Tax=Modicisalibacter coralii TaxID=2304602 RepID=UPI00100B3788|nr:STAS/SEC14 domain-containing protein [Halomonas coralii]
MLEMITAPAPHVVALRLSGRLDASELQKAIDAIEAAKQDHPRVSLYTELDALRWMTASALLRDLGYGLTQVGQLSHFHRAAAVSDHLWMRPLAALENHLFKPLEVRVFSNDHKHEAMAWVCELPDGQAGQETPPTSRQAG